MRGETSILRRTSFVVRDADGIATFYQNVFGWSRFYDNDTPVDARFPPCAPDGSIARVTILQADDPYIGMLGFLEYSTFEPSEAADKDKVKLGIGDPIMVVETKDIEATFERAKINGARLVSEPVNWTVTNYTGDGLIHLCTFSFFDPNGIYVEVNTRLKG